MKLVIDKEDLTRVLAISLYALVGGEYNDAKETAEELIENVGYTPLDTIIADIEAAKAKDKLCEYPYVRCVEIIKKAMGHEEKTMDEGNK